MSLNYGSGGAVSVKHLVSAASTNATVVKASPGRLVGWHIYNANAAARKIAFHDTASTPTAGSSVYFSIVVPATSQVQMPPAAVDFASGIAFTTVTEAADNGTTAVGSGDLIINLFYT